MELPQPRPFGAGGKKPTHDFLTLYGDTSFHHQDPRPSSHEFYLKTHDFLQPLERVGKSSSSREDASETVSSVEKASLIEHVLPGGIGTYSISHMSSFSSAVKAERAPFPDVRAASAERSSSDASKANGSNCNSFGKGAFTLWDESVVRDKVGEGHPAREAIEKKSAPFSPFASRAGFSSQPSSKQPQGQQKSMGFLEMMKSVKGPPENEDEDDDDFVKKEVPGQKGWSSFDEDEEDAREVGVKADGKGNDQKANAPRSKHSATEQRRRSKINDRFQILRELIPHSDQKRDKASFLLEVIEYIHFLQEKVQKYEAAFPGWNQGGMKIVPWKSNHGLGEAVADPSRGIKTGVGPGLMFAGKLEENEGSPVPAMLGNPQNPVESDNISPGTPYKILDHHPGLASKTVPVLSPSQQTTYTSIARSSGIAQPTQRWGSDSENRASRTQQQFGQRPSPVDSDNMSEQEELAVEGGTIRVSSIYSHGLLNSLTQALQSSGVDLSQASITVQIDLGKRAVSRPSTTTSSKDHEDPSSSNRTVANSRVASSVEDSHHQAQKRPRTS